MKQLLIGTDNTVTLDCTFVNKSGYTVTVTVLGEDGIALKNAQSGNMTDISATFDAEANKYKVQLNFKADTPQQYGRLFWRVLEGQTPKVLPEEFDPEEFNLTSFAVTAQQQIVPINYFLDYVISAQSKMDEELEEAVKAYPRQGIQKYLLAAQGTIENLIKMNFFLTEFNEKRDYTWDNLFGDTFWMHQMYHRPVKEGSVEIDLFHGSTKILALPSEGLIVEPTQGTVEFVPSSSSGGLLFQTLMATGDGITLAVIGRGTASRLPLAWHIKYKAGLDFPNLTPAKKESFRMGISRYALMSILPIIDPTMRTTTQSESMDGVSGSSSKSVDSIIKELKIQHDDWVRGIEKEYATGFDMVII